MISDNHKYSDRLTILLARMALVGAVSSAALFAWTLVTADPFCRKASGWGLRIAAGLILGPSLFGRFFPEISTKVFSPTVNPIFSIMSQVGLVLLMFLIGMEFEFGHLKQNRRAAVSVSPASTPEFIGTTPMRPPTTYLL